MLKESTVTYTFLISIKDIIDIKKIITEKIESLTNKNFNEKYGFLKSIKKILDFDIKKCSNNNFKSELLITVSFIGLFLYIEKNNIINCRITDINNITIGNYQNIKIMIIDDNTKNLKVGDNVDVKILATQIKLNHNYINAVATLNF